MQENDQKRDETEAKYTAQARQEGKSRSQYRQSGAYQGVFEQILITPLEQLLRFQDDFSDFVVFQMEQTSRRQSRNTNLAQSFLHNFVETIAVTTRLPAEFAQHGLNPFRADSLEPRTTRETYPEERIRPRMVRRQQRRQAVRPTRETRTQDRSEDDGHETPPAGTI